MRVRLTKMRLCGWPWLLLALLFALFASSAKAVVLVDNVSSVFGVNPTTLTVSHTTAGTDRLMIVGVSLRNDDFEFVSGVTYGGTPLNFVGQVSRGDDARVELWSYVDPPATTANVVVTFNQDVRRNAGFGVITFTGVDQTDPFGTFQSNDGRSRNPNISVGSAAGELVLGVMAARQVDSNPTVTAGDAQWIFKTQGGNNRSAGSGATSAGAASVNLSWNVTDNREWAVGAISLRDANAVKSLGFCDDFESGLGNWSIDASGGGSAGINGDTFNSAGNSLFTRWGVVNVTSAAAIDATGKSYQFSLWIRRGSDAFSEDPDAGEDLQAQYYNSAGSWVTLETFDGDGAAGQVYERNFVLPADARHANLRVRLRQTGGSGSDWDYWHIDDACILEVVQPRIEWRMDELEWNGTPNEVIDSSGNGNDANANAASGLDTVDPGQICRAGGFDGVDDYIESSDVFALLRDTASMSFWIRTTQTGNNIGWRAPGITGVEQAGGADDIFWGWLDASGRIGISVGDNYASKSTNPINDGTYHHVVLTRDATSGEYKIYIDGVLDRSGNLPTGLIGTSFSSVGRIEDTGGTPEYFEGDLDELLIFDSVLSDNAVTTIYQQQLNGRNLDGSERFCAGSLAFFRLDAASGSWNGTAGEVVDQSGNFNNAFALGTAAGVDAVAARVCNGIDVPFNNSAGAQYGFDSGIDIDADVGNQGTLSFWYRSNTNWVGGGNRMLADASPDDLPGADKYFYVVLLNNGRLRFALEDSNDGDYSFQTGVNNIAAGTWVHVAVTWDMSGNREIYLNGALAATDTRGTNGQIGALRTLYLGDNRSSYNPGATNNSANGVIDEVRVYARVQGAPEIMLDMNTTRACASVLDNFLVSVAASASTCLPTPVTIVARDSSNNVIPDYGGVISITTSSNNGLWSVNTADNPTSPNPDSSDDGAVGYTFGTADAGIVILDLANNLAETLTITVADVGAGVSSTSNPVSFADNVFIITEDPIQVAGRDQVMRVEMWVRDSGPDPSCGPDPDYDYNHDLDVSINRGGVLPGANDPVVNAVTSATAPDAPASNAVQFDFSGGTGSATFTLSTSDVGQYQLILTDNTGTHIPTPITGSSALLTVRPFGLALTDIQAGAVTNPGGTAFNSDVFTAAGADFEARVAGVLWSSADDPDNDGDLDPGAGRAFNDNGVTPSYAWLTTLNAAATGFTPATGTLGAFSNGGASPVQALAVDFGGGSATLTTLRYDEVGSFTLQASASGYLGIAGIDLASDDVIVGRFRPASFQVTGSTGGDFQDSCTLFTYIGEDFGYLNAPSFVVQALNAQNLATGNYRESFARLASGDFTVAVTQGAGVPLPVTRTAQDMTLVARNDDSGQVDVTFGADSYRYGTLVAGVSAKDPGSEVAPFAADINLEITQIDEIDVPAVAVSEVIDPTPNNMRFGRLRMVNALGTELDPLRMPVVVEYFNGSGYEVNSDDSCSVVQYLAPGQDLAIDDSNLSTPGASVPSIPVPLAGGVGEYEFSAPGAGVDGFIDVTTVLDDTGADLLWLRYDWDGDGNYDNDPGARASFGIFEGEPAQIYIQQTYE